jgi:hypothetical protein
MRVGTEGAEIRVFDETRFAVSQNECDSLACFVISRNIGRFRKNVFYKKVKKNIIFSRNSENKISRIRDCGR